MNNLGPIIVGLFALILTDLLPYFQNCEGVYNIDARDGFPIGITCMGCV